MDEELYREQLSKRDQQIEKLKSALGQSQQIHSLTQKNHETELTKIKG